MKYLTSLLMSLAVSASTFAGVDKATPVFDMVPRHTVAYKEAMNNRQAEMAKPMQFGSTKNFAQAALDLVDKRVGIPATNRVAAAANDVEIIASGYQSNWHDLTPYIGQPAWSCTIWSEDCSKEVTLTVSCDGDSPVGEYTVADMLDGWNYYINNEIGDGTSSFSSATISVTQGYRDNAYDMEATLVSTEGQTIHIVVYNEPHETQIYNVECTRMTQCRFKDWGWLCEWDFTITDDNIYIFIDMITSDVNFEGTYSLADIESTTSGVMIDGVEYRFESCNLVTTGQDPRVACEITGESVLKNGDIVNFHYRLDPPIEPEETIAFDATIEDLAFNSQDFGGNSHISAVSTNGLYKVDLAWKGTFGRFDQLVPAFTQVTDLQSDEVYAFDHGTLKVSLVEGNIKVSAELVCENAVCYNLTIDEQLKSTAEKYLEFSNLEILDAFGQLFILEGNDNEWSFSGVMVQKPQVGDCTNDISITLTSNEGNRVNALLVNSAAITSDENGYLVLDAEFLGDDLTTYTVHLYHYVPEITGERDLIATSGINITSYASDGFFYFNGYTNGNTASGLWFSYYADSYDLTRPQTFTEMNNWNTSNCKITDMATGETYKMYSCNFEYNWEAETKVYTLVGKCQAGSILWNVNITGIYDAQAAPGNDLDSQYSDADVTFAAEEIMDFEIDPGYGMAFVSAANEERMDEVALYFVMNGKDLAAGVYPINDSGMPGTCIAGACQDYFVTPSFYATMNEYGMLNLPLWLITSGTATVSYDAFGMPSIVVDAANTWGRSVHVVINPQTVAVENIANEDQKNGKFFENNTVVIRNNGKRYNGFGQMMK